MLSLFNTLSRSQQPFTPLAAPKVGMYNCGPTVYDYVHIGNLRALIFADTLRRVLSYDGYEVTQVMNITDVGHLTSDADTGEDKMMKGLKREGLPITLEGMRKLADIYTDAFNADARALNALPPTVMPRASEHIPEQIDLIKRLEEKGLTYTTSDGVYFSTGDYPAYGKLGGLSETSEEHARVATNDEKKDPRDFALWKFNPELGWESPWGKGFPGWHIECSAMSMKYLGESFDIHTGGIEHIAVHHNDEIAQAEGATGKEFSHFWLHNDHVRVEDRKMAKSEGTGFTRKDLEAHGVPPLAYRYWVLTGHYRSPLNFTWEAVEASKTALMRLQEALGALPDGGSNTEAYEARFREAIDDDLNTPKAVALMWELLKDVDVPAADKKATILGWDAVFGLSLNTPLTLDIPEAVAVLVARREEARQNKDWAASDTLRQEIEDAGFLIKDTAEGPKLSAK